MKLCICRNVSDSTFEEHLTSQNRSIKNAEKALTQCCGEPTNCGKCLDMADEMVDAHNRRVDIVNGLQHSISAPSPEEMA